MRGRGFTLFELMVVLLIIALTATVAAPAIASLDPDDADPPTRAVRDLSRLLRSARMTAMKEGQTVRLSVHLASGSYRATAGSGEEVDIVAEGRLDIPAGIALQGREESLEFAFSPLGTAYGGPVFVLGPEGARTVSLDPWTGDPIVQAR